MAITMNEDFISGGGRGGFGDLGGGGIFSGPKMFDVDLDNGKDAKESA